MTGPRGIRGDISLLVMLPLGAVYAVLIWRTEHAPLLYALICGLMTAAGAGASLAVIQWIERARLARTGRTMVDTTAHVVLALLFSSLWAGTIIALIALWASQRLTWYLQTALGWQLLLGFLVYAVIVGQRHLDRAHRALQEREAAVLRAELHALHARLNPHFLFNTLQSISALVRRDPDAADAAIERLSGLLRNVLRNDEDEPRDISLETEIGFVRSYLELEKLRLDERLRVVQDIDPDALDETIPPLTLQLLVENAIRHGIEPRPRGGTLTISAVATDGTLCVRIGDDGCGVSAEQVEAAAANGALGLRLVRERLRSRYGARGRVEFVRSPEHGFVVCLTVPIEQRAHV